MGYVDNQIALRSQMEFLIKTIKECSGDNDVSVVARKQAAILQMNMIGWEWDPIVYNAFKPKGIMREYWT